MKILLFVLKSIIFKGKFLSKVKVQQFDIIFIKKNLTDKAKYKTEIDQCEYFD